MVNKWEIYYCDLNPTIGSEQRGKRPVLVISKNSVNHKLSVATVLPFSSVKPGEIIYMSEVLLEPSVTGLHKLSVVMFQQIRTVSYERLSNLIGVITDVPTRKRISDACRDYFEL